MREWTVRIDGAIARAELDAIGRSLWAAVAAGQVTEADAEGIAARLHARQMGPRPKSQGMRYACRRQTTRSADRQRRLERRRRLAASGPMPPALAAKFTVGQLAALRIVGDEVRAHGACDRCLDEIAARAGVSRSTAKAALREAQRLGLLTVSERRRPGAKSLTNLVRIVGQAWLSWLRIGPERSAPGIGGKKRPPKDSQVFNRPAPAISPPVHPYSLTPYLGG